MNQYLDVLRDVLANGTRQKNRTGVDTFMIPGAKMQFDMLQGFPILTTKRVNFNAVAAELCGFIRGYSSAADFRALGTRIWDANANHNEQWLRNPNRKGDDDLGRIYGVQWRDWRAPGGERLDQLEYVVNQIVNNPESRRIVMTAWNPAELGLMALPPCHLLCQFLVTQEGRRLNLCMYMRSCDMFLGVPFNISSYALLLSLVASATRYNPGKLTMFLADCHIYTNHLEQVREQLTREPRKLPQLIIGSFRTDDVSPVKWLETKGPEDLFLLEYKPHPPIKGEMAV